MIRRSFLYTTAMKVLIVSPIFPPDAGGPAKQVYDQWLAFRDHDKLELWIVTFSPKKSFEREKNLVYLPLLQGVPLALGSLIRQVLLAVTMLRIIMQNHIDIIHAQDILVTGLMSGIIARLFGLPSVVKYPGDLVFEAINAQKLVENDLSRLVQFSYKARLLSWLQKLVFWLHHRVWVASKFQAKILEQIYQVRPEKILFLKNLISLPSESQAKHLKKGKPTILVIGRPKPWKQFEKITEVSGQLKTPVHFRIVGVTPYLAAQISQQFRHLTILHTLELEPAISPDNTAEAYHSAAIVLSLTCYEPFGIMFVEAAAAGVPVVAPQTGGIEEVVKHEKTGLLFPLNNWSAAASSIDRLIHDPALYHRLSTEALRCIQPFNIRTNTREVLGFYQKLMI